MQMKLQRLWISVFFAIIIIVACLLLWKHEGKSYTNNDNIPKGDGPQHPGWFSQYMEMKANGDGVIPFDKIRQMRQQLFSHQGTRTGNLLHVAELGPSNVGGRTRALVIDIANRDHLLAGCVSGGLWRSTNRGQSWQPIDDYLPTLSITSLTQNPFLPNQFYYSTGEVRGNSAGIPGDGVFKSENSGQSFAQLPATLNDTFNNTWRIAHSLVDTHTLFVATLQRGLMRSTDGGSSFHQVFTAGSGEVSDVEVFKDSSVMVGVRANGIYWSPNGEPGTFVKRDSGLPSSLFRRIELAYCDSLPNFIYAALEDNFSENLEGMYRSTDGGISWTPTTNPIQTFNYSFPWYCLMLAVKPNDPNFVVTGGAQFGYTQNGGFTWELADYSHADYHIAVFDPWDKNDFYVGNDGGVYKYRTNSIAFTNQDLNNGYNVTQFYAGTFFPNGIGCFGGTQDNGTQATQSANPVFNHINGGDGAFTQINQQDPNVSYVSYQNGKIRRADNSQSAFPNYFGVTYELDNDNDGNIDDGAWFINPFEMNRNDGEQLYFPTRTRLWRTKVGALFWEPITKTLTGEGRPYAVGISNNLYPTVYLGGSEGMFYRIDSAHWAKPGDEKNLSGSLPAALDAHFIANITVHPQFDSVVYISFSGYSDEPRLYKVANAKSDTPQWIPINGNLPIGLPVNWVEVSPLSDSVMVAATDLGLYSTVDGGVNWVLEPGIPKVSIHNIRLRYSDGKLFVFSHGRGIWTANLPGNFNTGIKSALPESAFEVYPNPTQDFLNIKLGESFKDMVLTVELFGVDGRMMLVSDFSGSKRLDLGGLPKGIYFVRLSENKKLVGVKKIILS